MFHMEPANVHLLELPATKSLVQRQSEASPSRRVVGLPAAQIQRPAERLTPREDQEGDTVAGAGPIDAVARSGCCYEQQGIIFNLGDPWGWYT